MPEVSVDGQLANPAAPPQQPAPEEGSAPARPNSTPPGITIQMGPDGKPVLVPQGTPQGEQGVYFRDDHGVRGGGQPSFAGQGGALPENHVVRPGDTLWDICIYYFNNPWDWPRIWSYNPQITNPHWIYPGDQVRLYPAGKHPDAASGRPVGVEAQAPTPTQHRSFALRQLAFVDSENIKYAAEVDGSADEKLLISAGDIIYLRYNDKHPLEPGKRYAVYEPTTEVVHPTTGAKVGAYVRVVGEVEVRSARRGKRARAVVTDSPDPVERGYKVGPLQLQFRDVQPTAARVDLQGTIVAQLFADYLIGARWVVIIDKGTRDHLRTGNRLFVIRRGDAYPKLGERISSKGQNDRRYPAEAIGEVMIVQVGKTSSVGLVTQSLHDFEIGDLVLMRRDRDAEEDTATRDSDE
jgi:hypothetical protein